MALAAFAREGWYRDELLKLHLAPAEVLLLTACTHDGVSVVCISEDTMHASPRMSPQLPRGGEPNLAEAQIQLKKLAIATVERPAVLHAHGN